MGRLVDNTDYTQLRQQVGTQAYVAKLLGVGVRTIQRRESGELPVTREAYLAIMVLAEDVGVEDIRLLPRLQGR
jgi:hypothetical protein